MKGYWINHVIDIEDPERFGVYTEASMPHFTNTTFGTVVHQHAGEQNIQLATALGVDSISKAMEIYHSSEYRVALAAGGMEVDETHVVQRTICAIEVSQ